MLDRSCVSRDGIPPKLHKSSRLAEVVLRHVSNQATLVRLSPTGRREDELEEIRANRTWASPFLSSPVLSANRPFVLGPVLVRKDVGQKREKKEEREKKGRGGKEGKKGHRAAPEG